MALRLIGDLTGNEASQLLEDFLVDSDDRIRLLAVSVLRARYHPMSLADLLSRYAKRSTYFYNVVVWLDRIIYAPSPLRSYYENEMRNKLDALGA